MRWKRLALLPALVLVYVLVAEGGLQIAGFFLQRTTRAEFPGAWVTDNLRVLCLGDSNTYGLWVERNQAYPQQLAAVWNERIKAPKLEVLNLGLPGANSSRLVRELPYLIETYAPDILIVMVGVNDYWTLPVPIDDVPTTRPPVSFLKRHSLIYRLYYLIRRARQSSETEIILDPNSTITGRGEHKIRVGDREFQLGYESDPVFYDGDSNALRDNLRRLVGLARDAGTPLYLMNYPARHKFYRFANIVITAVANETGTPLIDLRSVFVPICPQQDCPETLFPDAHPKPRGYRIVAETILQRLARRGPS